jgi:hypothetical protein
MGFFNSILVDGKCPECGLQSTLVFQTKMACSSFGDKNGRFAMQNYHIGDTLRWWRDNDE